MIPLEGGALPWYNAIVLKTDVEPGDSGECGVFSFNAGKNGAAEQNLRPSERTAMSMKRLLALSGTPHGGGITEKLLDLFLENVPEDTVIDRVRAYEERFEPCDDCGECRKKFGCVKRDHAGFFEFLERSDDIIVATPVYLNSFPAPLKSVFDRFQQYYSARFALRMRPPIRKPKRAFLILSQGSGNGDGPEMLEKQCRKAFSVMNTVLCGSYVLKNTDQKKTEGFPLETETLRQESLRYFQKES